MNPGEEIPLEYGAPPPTVTKHDHIYTTLLAIYGFLKVDKKLPRSPEG